MYFQFTINFQCDNLLIMKKKKINKKEKVVNLLDLAGFIKAPKEVDALKARGYMGKHYKRV